MKTLEIHATGVTLVNAIKALDGQPLALLEDGQPVAVLVPSWGADMETISLSYNPKFIAMLTRSDQKYRNEDCISAEEMRRLVAEMPEHNSAAKKRSRAKRVTKK
jgi:hypothetical protein